MTTLDTLLNDLKLPKFSTYSELERFRADENNSLLRKILEDTSLQRSLAAEQVNRSRMSLLQRSYPDWAYDIAGVFVNRDNKYSFRMKEMVYEICSQMMQELANGKIEYVQMVSTNKDCRLLSKVASDLNGFEKPHDAITIENPEGGSDDYSL